jgi:hypothetical protein
VDSLCALLGTLGRLLHSSDGRLGSSSSSTAVTATAGGLAAVADKVIEGLIQVGRHDEDLREEMGKAGDSGFLGGCKNASMTNAPES